MGPNAVILGDADNEKLVKYWVDDKYSEVWRKDFPPNVTLFSYLHLTPSLIICQNDIRQPTQAFSHDLHPQQTYTGEYGNFCGTIPQDRVLYAKVQEMCEANYYCVDIYQLPAHKKLGTLTRPGDPFKHYDISVGCHRNTGWLAAVDGWDYGSQSMDIYDSSYNHQTHLDLLYQPLATNGIAAVKDCIIVAGYDECLHVYNWGGEEVGEVTREQLVLEGESIYGIAPAGESGLSIAAGLSCSGVKSLHLYHVEQQMKKNANWM